MLATSRCPRIREPMTKSWLPGDRIDKSGDNFGMIAAVAVHERDDLGPRTPPRSLRAGRRGHSRDPPRRHGLPPPGTGDVASVLPPSATMIAETMSRGTRSDERAMASASFRVGMTIATAAQTCRLSPSQGSSVGRNWRSKSVEVDSSPVRNAGVGGPFQIAPRDLRGRRESIMFVTALAKTARCSTTVVREPFAGHTSTSMAADHVTRPGLP